MATYPSDPVAAFSAGTTYFDVHTAPGGSFSAVTVTVCGLATGQTLSWWNPSAQAWQKVSPQSAVDATGCITANLSGTSKPTVAQLVRHGLRHHQAAHHNTQDNRAQDNRAQDNTPPPPPPPAKTAGYDMVGSDGGVFVFSPPGTTGGFFGSLPGLGVKVNNIVGMVPTANDQGYFLVGSDGGSLRLRERPVPGLAAGPRREAHPAHHRSRAHGHRRGLLPGRQGRRGLRLRQRHRTWGPCRGIGVHRDDIIGIAATPSGNGYWLVAADGTVYGFGAAQTLGSATGTSPRR